MSRPRNARAAADGPPSAPAGAADGRAPAAARSLASLLRQRRSVRGFRPDPVPQGTIDTIFSLARLAPSNCNAQPWMIHVVSGGAAERMRSALHAAALAGAAPGPDLPLTGAYPGRYRARQVAAAKALFAATGVARDDRAARTDSFLRNFRFFDAPHAAFLFLPEWAGWREVSDLGMYAQTLLLAMQAHGVASCAQGALGHHAATVRSVLGLDDGSKLLFGIAFGFEDAAHPANAARTDRAPLAEDHRFHD